MSQSASLFGCLSFYVCMSLPFSVSLALYVFLYRQCRILHLCWSVSLSVYVCRSFCHSLALSIHVFLYLQCLFVRPSVFESLSLSLSLPPPPPPTHTHTFSLHGSLQGIETEKDRNYNCENKASQIE